MATVAVHGVCSSPDLGTINTNNEHAHHDWPVSNKPFDKILHLSSDSAVVPETPTSSDLSTGRSNPIAVLARPLEGFHHPRRHVFTDRLAGRFFEDNSLHAKTRKTNSKCLAGRLCTAESRGHRRPSTAEEASALLLDVRSRSGHSKRMQHRASTRALGGVRQAKGAMKAGISAKMKQVQKEIMEQKLLIEELEGRMSSLSSVRRAAHIQEVEALAAQKSMIAPSLAHYGFGNRKQDADGQSTMTPGTVDLADAKYILDRSEFRAARSCHIRTALSNQLNIVEDGNCNRLFSLRSTLQKFESQLQSFLQKAGTLAHELRSRPATDAVAVEVSRVAAAAELVVEVSVGGNFVELPADNLRSLISGMEWIRKTLASLAAAVRENNERRDVLQAHSAIELSFSVVECTFEAIRKALNADVGIDGSTLSDIINPSSANHYSPFPVGSGRAAAVASTGYTKGGLLVSPDALNHRENFSEEPERTVKGGGSSSSYKAQRGGLGQTGRVELSALGVEGVEQLLRANGFGEHAPSFVSQAVDGFMLSDPNLCEADFLELELGGKSSESDHSRVKLVAFFQRCQNEGVTPSWGAWSFSEDEGVTLSWGAWPLSEGGAGTRPGTSSGTHSKPDLKGNNGMSVGSRQEKLNCARRSVKEVEELNMLKPSEECISRAGPKQSFRLGTSLCRSQDMAVDIPIEANVRATALVPPGESKILPVKLNYGVIVTMNGNEVEVVRSVDGYSDDESIKDDSDGKGGAVVPPREAPYAVQDDSNETSLKLPVVSIQNVCFQPGDREICTTVDEELPPGLVVKTSNVTLDVLT